MIPGILWLAAALVWAAVFGRRHTNHEYLFAAFAALVSTASAVFAVLLIGG